VPRETITSQSPRPDQISFLAWRAVSFPTGPLRVPLDAGRPSYHHGVIVWAPTMSDPLSRLEVVQREVDRCFGGGFAAANPQLVAAVLAAASSDFAATLIARSLQDIAAALVEEEPQRILPAHELLRPRP
jgi:hypothetical protein